MTKQKKQKTNKYFDLQFIFKYVFVECIIDDELYSKEEKQKIYDIIKLLSKEIVIDKSYVQFKDNKHEDVFILEEGWNSVCKLAIDTKYGKNATKSENLILMESYMLMILCYLYHCLEILGYSSDGIIIDFTNKSKFMVEIHKDTINEWKYYPGKWQTWEQYKK